MNNSPLALVVHVVPRLPPAVCGVGDYAALIGEQVQKLRPSLYSGYVACGFRPEPLPLNGPGCRNITGACDRAELWRAVNGLVDELDPPLDELTLVVHYSGYGYDRGGAPRWLADALERRPPRVASASIVTMFHELYAEGWPWQRAFWSSRRQRDVAARLARLSDGLMTNRAGYAAWLEKVTGRAGGSVPRLPVVSNVGEPASVPSWNARGPCAVAFGAAGNKRLFLDARAEETAAMLARLGINEVLDIGAPAEIRGGPFEKWGINIEQLGFSERENVSKLLLGARIGLIDYPASFIEKSSVFAAYSAHALASVLADRKDGASSADRCFPGYTVSELANSSQPADLCEAAASEARLWYLAHSADTHARTLLALILRSSNSPTFSLMRQHVFTWR